MKQIVKKTTLSLIATILLIVPQPSNAATWKQWFLGTTIAAITLYSGYQSYKNYTKGNPFEAIRKNDIPRVKDCISQGADINIKDMYGDTPLHIATKNMNIKIIQLLIQNKADINIQDNNGWTPLHRAAFYGYIEIVKLLIKNKADINIQNNNGWTPLHHAARYGRHKIIKLLIQNGADINIKDNNNRTPLHITASYGRHKIVELLIQNGADINIKNNNNRTPLDIARQKNQQVMVTYLQNVQNELKTFTLNPSKSTIHASKSAYFKMLCKNTLYTVLSNFYILLDNTHHNNLEIVTKNLSNTNKNNIIKLGFYLTPEEFKMKKNMLHFNQHVDCKILYEDKKFSL